MIIPMEIECVPSLRRKTLEVLGLDLVACTIHVSWRRQNWEAWEVDSGICQTKTLPLSLLFWWCMFRSSCSAVSQIPDKRDPTRVITLPGGARVRYPSQWDISLQIPVGNFFPRCDEAYCSQQHSMLLIHGEMWGSGCFLLFPLLYNYWVHW